MLKWTEWEKEEGKGRFGMLLDRSLKREKKEKKKPIVVEGRMRHGFPSYIVAQKKGEESLLVVRLGSWLYGMLDCLLRYRREYPRWASRNPPRRSKLFFSLLSWSSLSLSLSLGRFAELLVPAMVTHCRNIDSEGCLDPGDESQSERVKPRVFLYCWHPSYWKRAPCGAIKYSSLSTMVPSFPLRIIPPITTTMTII